ncbi:unnamed protein product [Schistosoma intercalatum]|nr:unnamed protein product [Schistosoma intercalatum]
MKAWKLQECIAHSPGAVTAATLGRKSGRVMATGGEDRRLKLWAVGKPSCILSLTGHTSSIEASEFSQEEDRVAAGSLSGSVRIWDLEEVKTLFTTYWVRMLVCLQRIINYNGHFGSMTIGYDTVLLDFCSFCHVETTCQIVRVIIKNFAPVIRQTIEGPTPPGVDLMREERRRKCQECLSHLLTIRSALGTRDVANKAGQCGRELNVMFQLLV